MTVKPSGPHPDKNITRTEDVTPPGGSLRVTKLHLSDSARRVVDLGRASFSVRKRIDITPPGSRLRATEIHLTDDELEASDLKGAPLKR